MSTHIEKMARFISELEYSKIPARTLSAARMQVLDMVAAVHAAGKSKDIRSFLEAASGFSPGQGNSTVLISGIRKGPAGAAMANAICSMAFDYDDIIWMGHTCHSAVFSSLAVAEQEGRSPEEFLTAVVAANEVSGRLGASCFFGPLNGQMWTFIHLLGAAAATSRLLGLDAERTANALSIALSQPNFALQPGFLGTASKLLAAAVPASIGIVSAYFARSGMTGEHGIIEVPKGFWSYFSFMPMPEMLEGLGKFWVTDTLTIKTYPGCHYFQTAFVALDAIRAKRGAFMPANLKSIIIDTTKLAVEVTRFAGEFRGDKLGISPVNVAFDLSLGAAMLLHSGGIDTANLCDDYLEANRQGLDAWARLVRIVHDPMLTARVVMSVRGIPQGEKALKSIRFRDLVKAVGRYSEEYGSGLFSPMDIPGSVSGFIRGRKISGGESAGLMKDHPALFFPSRVTVEFKNGEKEVAQVNLPPGSMANPGMERELHTKFMKEAVRTLGEERAKRAFQGGMNIEKYPLGDFVRSVTWYNDYRRSFDF